MTEDEIRDRLAAFAGPLKAQAKLASSVVPFPVIAAALDRRPGRLVSYLCARTAA